MKKNNITKKDYNLLFSVIERYGFIILLLVFVGIFSIFNPRFISFQNIANISIQVVPIAIIALGSVFVLISGGLDLTVGIGVSLSAVVLEAVFRPTHNVPITLLAMFSVVLILGAINAVLVTKIKIVPIIATLVMMTIIQGAVFVITRLGTTDTVSNPLFLFIARGNILGIPTAFFITIVLYVIGYVILNHTRLGFYLIAIGNNLEGARLAGISIYRYLFYPYLISGFCMGMAALVVVSRVLYVTPNLGGTSLLLDAIAACIIGGIAINGGKGTIQGALIGAFSITIINNMINVINIHPAWNQFFKGLVIIFMMLLNRLLQNIEDNRKVT